MSDSLIHQTTSSSLAMTAKRQEIREKVGAGLLGDGDPKHDDFERSGDFNMLQRYRFANWRKHPKHEETVWIQHSLFFVEEDMREIVQEEARLRSLLKDKERRSDSLEVKYWLLKQQWWQLYSCLMVDYQRPAFDLWRSNPRWYMHHTLVEDCAVRGGCCARECGCCSRRESETGNTRRLGVGHCTLECGCCRKDRGFDIPEKEKVHLKKKCRAEIHKVSTHPIIRVAMWGLVGGVFDSPFDMIDAPPSYGHQLLPQYRA